MAALEWPDSNSQILAQKCGRTLCVACVGEPRLHALLGGEMLKVHIRSPSSPLKANQMQAALRSALVGFGGGATTGLDGSDPSLIREALTVLGPVCPYPRQLFLALPGRFASCTNYEHQHTFVCAHSGSNAALVDQLQMQLHQEPRAKAQKVQAADECCCALNA